MERAGEEFEVGATVDPEDSQHGPSMDGRVHIAERPLVGGNLAVRVHVPLAAQQQQLMLRGG
ncbi:MAG: hypothetical protein NTZ61_02685, partial [Proteobacteria bacterium]|nr:hypothetical protein [Pseudomonadota bacterium]